MRVWCRAKEEPYIASMGIYVAKASAIRDLLLTHFPEVRHPVHYHTGKLLLHNVTMMRRCFWYHRLHIEYPSFWPARPSMS